MTRDEDKLFCDYAAEQISEEDFRRLHTLLEQDPQLRIAFLEYMNTCAFLEDSASYSEELFNHPTELAPDSIPAKPAPAKSLKFPTWVIAAAAAVALAFVTWTLRPTAPPNSITTRVVASLNVSAEQSGQTFTVGDELQLNTIALNSGLVRLELPRGIVFDIFGPAKGHFENETRFHLEYGRVNVDVGPHGKGFTIVTANAEIVDLGTQFGVDVDQNADAKVAVFSGEVEVHSVGGPSNPRLLTVGEGVQVDSGGKSSRLMSITMPDEAEPDTPQFNQSSQFEIRDNLTTPDNLRYYGIINGGMREGAKVYTTHASVRWRGSTNESFPVDLVGADLIQTFNNDRNNEQLSIDISVHADSTLFVIFDDRYAPPAWLQDNFIDTGKNVISGPWKPVAIVHDILPDSQGDFYVTYRIWQTQLTAHQTIVLGESIDPEFRDNLRAMYGIALKPSSPANAESMAILHP